jgi:hypothetical protein
VPVNQYRAMLSNCRARLTPPPASDRVSANATSFSPSQASTLAKEKFPRLRIVTLMDSGVLRGGLHVAQSSLQWQ